MLIRPNFLPPDLSAAPLDFIWNNEVAVSLSNPDKAPSRLAKAIWGLNYKAQAGLALVALEWVLWRLEGRTDVSDPLQRIEAAWACLANVAYTRSLDFDDVTDDVNTQGNPDGPRQEVLTLLDDWHYAYTGGDANLGFAAITSAYLGQIVTPPDSGYEAWLQRTLKALHSAYPASPGYSTRDHSYDHSGEPPIPPAWFEKLTVPPDEAANRADWNHFLGNLDPAQNPYLVPADELRADGFDGVPYRMA